VGGVCVEELGGYLEGDFVSGGVLRGVVRTWEFWMDFEYFWVEIAWSLGILVVFMWHLGWENDALCWSILFGECGESHISDGLLYLRIVAGALARTFAVFVSMRAQWLVPCFFPSIHGLRNLVVDRPVPGLAVVLRSR